MTCSPDHSPLTARDLSSMLCLSLGLHMSVTKTKTSRFQQLFYASNLGVECLQKKCAAHQCDLVDQSRGEEEEKEKTR